MRTRIAVKTTPFDLTQTGFRCDLKRTFSNVTRVKLLSASFANTNPNIEKNQRDMLSFVMENEPGKKYTIRIPEGSYSHTELFAFLADDLNSHFNIGRFSFEYANFRTTIICTESFRIIFDEPTSIAPLLGFIDFPNPDIFAYRLTGNVPIRLNTQQSVVVKIRGMERLEVPSLSIVGSFSIW